MKFNFVKGKLFIQLPADADAGGEVLAHAVRDEELGVLGPAVGALGEPDLLPAERLAVRRARVLLVRRAEGKELHVEMRDSGVGLASDSRSRVFEAFCMAKQSGLGMELSISQSILRRKWMAGGCSSSDPRTAACVY